MTQAKKNDPEGNEPGNDPEKRKYFGFLPPTSSWFPQMTFF